jgi:hypothetical protein
MTDLDITSLEATIGSNSPIELARGARLIAPSPPDPFVSPRLELRNPEASPLQSEILIITSPAAVGKSTVAKHLAASGGSPLLDLSEVPVSTNSLAGLLATDLERPRDAIAALNRGDLCVIVDALDEGRMLSGDVNFEEFLSTTWELLLSNRAVRDRPKVILLGRDVASQIVDLSLAIDAGDLTVSHLSLEFFGEQDAIAVIEAHATHTATKDGRVWRSTSPSRKVISTFFDSIATALGVERSALWSVPDGRAFAGYAPVLAAIGSILAFEPNPERLNQALQREGTARAWDVIARVAETILFRERDEKVVPQLVSQLSGNAPDNAYDTPEQLTLLTQFVSGKPLRPTGRVELAPHDAEVYDRIVSQHLPEHPFLQDGKFANSVVESIVLAYAIVSDLLDSESSIPFDASRQPFLWRSVQRLVDTGEYALIRGQSVGFILNSLWNDELAGDMRVSIRPSYDPEIHSAVFQGANGAWSIDFLAPVHFYEQIRDCDVRTSDDAVWRAHLGGQDVASFDIRGNVDCLIEHDLVVDASSVRLDGRLRLQAATVRQPPSLRLSIANGSEVWWGEELASTYPWRTVSATLPPPVPREPADDFERFLRACAERLGATPLTLTAAYLPTNDNRVDWINRDYSGERFAAMIRLLADDGWVRSTSTPARGPEPRVVVHFNVSWDQLERVAGDPSSADPRLASLVSTMRDVFDGSR